jgi:hypothetical protein
MLLINLSTVDLGRCPDEDLPNEARRGFLRGGNRRGNHNDVGIFSLVYLRELYLRSARGCIVITEQAQTLTVVVVEEAGGRVSV